ncbi:hypothetical protein DWV13_16570 [Clostridium botulinum]|uniref:hypothetical protein n=1 Tax=Clostridium TaxID=1485 RepID=UPI0013F90EB6|nr:MULTISPECIES: hypothetical protein [Clostridium]MCS6133208.1 hypothetical protein [Clostridium botulinum]NFL45979.1 hypothetical protein [Clostridium botulinum]NFL90965.1 hypothetical protein [Clostridium botulinum]
MKVLDRFLKVEKKVLLLIAGLVWSFAGFRVLILGIGDVKNNGNFIVDLIFAAIISSIFFKFVFSKMYNKHTKRIVTSELEKHCIFSFFDVRSYFIMGFMIFLGINVRNLGIFNPVYVGIFYMGLGCALLMAGILFLISSLNFKKVKLRYNN